MSHSTYRRGFQDDEEMPSTPTVGRATAPAPPSGLDSRFNPGSIMEHYKDSHAVFLPTDIHPVVHRGTCFEAQHLAFKDFVLLRVLGKDVAVETQVPRRGWRGMVAAMVMAGGSWGWGDADGISSQSFP